MRRRSAHLIATGVNAEGLPRDPGHPGSPPRTAGWLAFFRDLVRGLSGVALVASDAHAGLVAADATPACSAWQRCRTHYAANLRQPPRPPGRGVRTLLHSIYDQPDAKPVVAQYDRVTRSGLTNSPRWPSTSHRPHRPAGVHRLPKKIWRQIWVHKS